MGLAPEWKDGPCDGELPALDDRLHARPPQQEG